MWEGGNIGNIFNLVLSCHYQHLVCGKGICKIPSFQGFPKPTRARMASSTASSLAFYRTSCWQRSASLSNPPSLFSGPAHVTVKILRYQHPAQMLSIAPPLLPSQIQTLLLPPAPRTGTTFSSQIPLFLRPLSSSRTSPRFPSLPPSDVQQPGGFSEFS